MLKTKAIIKKFIFLGFAVLALMVLGSIHNGVGTVEVFAATENIPTIRMRDNAPMTRHEFTEWANQRGIRHINIDGRLYPVGIFFSWAHGQSFNYGNLNNGVLYVVLQPDAAIESGGISSPGESNANEHITQEPQTNNYPMLVIFTERSPILFSDDELTAMIESVPHQNPLDVISSITIPNRRLTEAEIEVWIAEYNEMGGVTALELAVVREVNRVREQYGLQLLALDPALMMSARLKTQEFGDLQYFAHNSPIHGSVTEAARMFGFEGRRVSETITQSGSSSAPVFRTSAERIVGGMLASTRGHREILLNPNASSMGFGAFFSPNSTGRDGNMSHMFYFATKFGFYD